MTGRHDEGVALALEALALARASGDSGELAWSLTTAALAQGVRGEYDQGRALFEESLATIPPPSIDRMRVLHNYGELELAAGNLDRSRMLLEDGLEQARARTTSVS